jgi:hypothetical protein
MPPDKPQCIADENSARDYLLLALTSAALSLAALAFYFHHDQVLLYGDAVAHINIARRVFDSRTPGIFQLGTVWLPLPHVLDIPFVVNEWLWRTGVGGAIPSMLAYIAGCIGIFRLVRGRASRLTAWAAALIYALNPNLLYLQSTAMTESLYLALFIWAVVYLSEFAQSAAEYPERARAALGRCALCSSAAMLVRYDGWFLAAIIAIAAAIVASRARMPIFKVRHGLLQYVLLTGATAALWMAYNYNLFDNALEFATGPYSARAIQQRNWTPTWTSYPGEGSPRTAALYFLKVSRLNLGEAKGEYLLLSVAFVSLLCVFFFARRFLPWTLLWSPLIFYVVCISWGSVPVYLPQWWPFGFYNVRYGLQMLPAVAVFTALVVEFSAKLVPARESRAAAVIFLLAAFSYGSAWERSPITLREAEVNGKARLDFERQLADRLKQLPASATMMMDCSSYSGAIQAAGIPFRRVLRESNPPLWEIALSQPGRSADYVIAIDRDAVALSVRLFPQNLDVIDVIQGSGGRHATIYRSAP